MRGKERCEFCCYWKKLPNVLKLKSGEQGLCRRHSPILREIPNRKDSPVVFVTFGMGEFPITNEGDWCGDYK